MFDKMISIFIMILLLALPLVIQLILYPIAKLCFKKIPPPIVYTICLAVNTILLNVINNEWLNPPENMEEPMDAFDGLIMMLMWSPWYMGVCISCITRIVKAIKSNRNGDDSNFR